jgi:hypothetical protein
MALEKQDTSKYTNEFLKLFEEYRNENVNIRKWIKRFESTFNEVSKLQQSIKKNIDDKDMFDKKSKDVEKEVFDSLTRDLETMKQAAVKILSQIEKEDPKISEFIGRISHDEISTAGFSFDLIKEYNKEKFLAIQEFVGLMPHFSKDLTGVIELPMIAMSDSAGHFDKFCVELITVIKRVPSRGAMFESLGILLNYLVNYVGNVETLSQNDKIKFVGLLSENRSKVIAENFLNSFGVASSIFDQFSKLLTSLDIKLSSSSNDGSTYNSLDKAKQEKVDKFTHNTLKVLFVKVAGVDKGKSLLDIINKDIFKSDLSDVIKEFNDKYIALVNSKFSKLSYNNKNSYENLFFICDGLDKEMSFKDFMKNKLTDKDLIEKASVYLTTLINSKDDKDPYKSFVEYNSTTKSVLVKEDKNSDSGSSDSGNKFSGDKLKDDDVVGALSELFSNLDSSVNIVHTIIGDKQTYEGDNIKAEVLSNVESFLFQIRNDLNIIGKNLSVYRSKRKSMWNDTVFKSYEGEIDNIIKLIGGDISSSQNINFIIGKVDSLVKVLK